DERWLAEDDEGEDEVAEEEREGREDVVHETLDAIAGARPDVLATMAQALTEVLVAVLGEFDCGEEGDGARRSLCCFTGSFCLSQPHNTAHSDIVAATLAEDGQLALLEQLLDDRDSGSAVVLGVLACVEQLTVSTTLARPLLSCQCAILFRERGLLR